MFEVDTSPQGPFEANIFEGDLKNLALENRGSSKKFEHRRKKTLSTFGTKYFEQWLQEKHLAPNID